MRDERITYRVIPGVLLQWARSTSVSALQCVRIRTRVRTYPYFSALPDVLQGCFGSTMRLA